MGRLHLAAENELIILAKLIYSKQVKSGCLKKKNAQLALESYFAIDQRE